MIICPPEFFKTERTKMKFTKETFYRALRTFFQAALGFIAASGAAVFSEDGSSGARSAVIALAGSAAAAGIAAVMNLESEEE